MKISVYIIAFNEVEKIRECINSILWADEIILADSHSTDGTSEIAQELGTLFFDASNVVTTNEIDGLHWDKYQHNEFGLYLSKFIRSTIF